MKTRIVERPRDARAHDRLLSAGVEPLLARLYAGRGVTSPADLSTGLAELEPPFGLMNVRAAASLLAAAIRERRRILVVADYDCDGATACAVALRGLRMFGAHVDYLVPNRFEYGYGLTPEIVRLAQRSFAPQLIVTVDNGIASVAGVAVAASLGIDVLVTDHHLPGQTLPRAACIVNPNQPGCSFASKNLAGVGVMFYVLLALRAHLREEGRFRGGPEPRLDTLLDLVALGTVADVVRLDANNRRLVAQGLKRIRSARMQPGVAALFMAAQREARSASAFDLGFAIGPRINAAGRMADMSLGIECLVTDDPGRAEEIARQLDAINRERRGVEAQMQEEALAALAALEALQAEGGAARDLERASLCLYDPAWHQGVVGILAARLKDRFNRPTIAFAPNADGMLRGSARSIAGLHMRDALDLVSKRHPDLIERFGGHAMAAGLTLAPGHFAAFCEAFEGAVRLLLDPALLERTIEVDGPLAAHECTLTSARLIAAQVWGQGFAAPLFCDTFQIDQQRVLRERHLKLALRKGRDTFEAIWFNHNAALGDTARLVYRLEEDTFNGQGRLQFIVEHAEPA